MADRATVWRERLVAWRAGDLSAAAFCRQHGLAYATFGYWQRKLRAEGRGLVPVLVDAPAASPGLSLEVQLSRGVALRVGGATAADVMALIRGLSC